jgi:hypothetical protein
VGNSQALASASETDLEISECFIVEAGPDSLKKVML